MNIFAEHPGAFQSWFSTPGLARGAFGSPVRVSRLAAGGFARPLATSRMAPSMFEQSSRAPRTLPGMFREAFPTSRTARETFGQAFPTCRTAPQTFGQRFRASRTVSETFRKPFRIRITTTGNFVQQLLTSKSRVEAPPKSFHASKVPNRTETPNLALQRTGAAVTPAASAAAFPPATQRSRQPRRSLSLRSLAVTERLLTSAPKTTPLRNQHPTP